LLGFFAQEINLILVLWLIGDVLYFVAFMILSHYHTKGLQTGILPSRSVKPKSSQRKSHYRTPLLLDAYTKPRSRSNSANTKTSETRLSSGVED